jgi:cytidine deaminase
MWQAAVSAAAAARGWNRMSDEGKALIVAARTAAENAYAPYSNFAVGAAVLLSDGTVVTGANFENASYGLSLCAETVALATASAQGRLRDVVAIGVIGGRIGQADTTPVNPCGRCRQIINEAAQLGGRDIAVYCSGAAGDSIVEYRLSQLLPDAFGPKELGLR